MNVKEGTTYYEQHKEERRLYQNAFYQRNKDSILKKRAEERKQKTKKYKDQTQRDTERACVKRLLVRTKELQGLLKKYPDLVERYG